MKTIFLLGRDPKKGTKKSEIENENNIHGDILMARADSTSFSSTIVRILRSSITLLKLKSTLQKLTSTIRSKTWRSKNICFLISFAIILKMLILSIKACFNMNFEFTSVQSAIQPASYNVNETRIKETVICLLILQWFLALLLTI